MSGAEIATSLLEAGLSPYKILNVLYFPFSVSTRYFAVVMLLVQTGAESLFRLPIGRLNL